MHREQWLRLGGREMVTDCVIPGYLEAPSPLGSAITSEAEALQVDGSRRTTLNVSAPAAVGDTQSVGYSEVLGKVNCRLVAQVQIPRLGVKRAHSNLARTAARVGHSKYPS